MGTAEDPIRISPSRLSRATIASLAMILTRLSILARQLATPAPPPPFDSQRQQLYIRSKMASRLRISCMCRIADLISLPQAFDVADRYEIVILGGES